jgi:hypothetical protein
MPKMPPPPLKKGPKHEVEAHFSGRKVTVTLPPKLEVGQHSSLKALRITVRNPRATGNMLGTLLIGQGNIRWQSGGKMYTKNWEVFKTWIEG